MLTWFVSHCATKHMVSSTPAVGQVCFTTPVIHFDELPTLKQHLAQG